MSQPFTVLPDLPLIYLDPPEMIAAIESTGRSVSIHRDMLPVKFNHNAKVARLAFTLPKLFGRPGGSFRAIDGHIRSTSGLQTVPRFIACNFALNHPLEPTGPDIITAIDPVLGRDGRPYLFYVCNGNESLRGILEHEGGLCHPAFGAIAIPAPDDSDKNRDYIASDQLLLYLAPAE